jgi:hypothetical protein
VEDVLQVPATEDMLARLHELSRMFSFDFEDHLQGIEGLLLAVRKAGFKLSGKKLEFGTQSVNFLGHTIDRTGVSAQQEKREIIRQWPPHKMKQSRGNFSKFDFICTFWRSSVNFFFEIAAPLHELLNNSRSHRTQECEQTFNTLKKLLCDAGTTKSTWPLAVTYNVSISNRNTIGVNT